MLGRVGQVHDLPTARRAAFSDTIVRTRAPSGHGPAPRKLNQ